MQHTHKLLHEQLWTRPFVRRKVVDDADTALLETSYDSVSVFPHHRLSSGST